jgi:hypothetical protein
MTRTSIVGSGSRERLGVIGLAALIVVSVAVYLALKSSVLESTGAGHLLPYQTLVRTMPSADQAMFEQLQQRVIEIEEVRARTGQWPLAEALAPDPPYRWEYSRDRFVLNYLAAPPEEASDAAWLVVIQEPDPQAPVDRAPNDETHHRLPDGTVLHVTVWTHRFGGQMTPKFVRQPETAGWTQVIRAPLPPTPPPAGN